VSPAAREHARLAEVPRFAGGRGLLVGSAVAGAVGMAATLVLGLVAPRQTLFSYLLALLFWLTLAVGMLGWLASFHAAHARWMVVLRRLMEAMTAPLAVLAVLFIPLAAATGHVYDWPEHKRFYFNLGFWIGRAAVYFGIWIAVAHLLWRWSVRQDGDGALAWTRRQRVLSAAALPPIGLALTFAAFDWVMSLHPDWQSTIFGLYLLGGAQAGSIALVIVVATGAERGGGPLAGMLTRAHFHSLGKLLLSFVCFWGYMAFSQYMLMWIGNLPEEIPWYLVRTHGAWKPIAIALALGHFGVPFLILLSAQLKRRPVGLSAVAAWILVIHLVDCYWLIMPELHPGSAMPHLADLTALVGVGGLCAAFVVWRLRGHFPVPIRDPYAAQALRYDPP
jgi:hypothetical protein